MLLSTLAIAWRLIVVNAATVRARFSLSFLTAIVRGMGMFFVPFFLGRFVEDVSSGTVQQLPASFYLLLGVAALYVVNSWIYRRFFEVIGFNISINAHYYFFNKIYYQKFSWHIENSTGYMVSAAKRVATNLENFVFKIFWNYVPFLVVLLCFLAYSLNLSFWLFLYFALFLSVILLVSRIAYNRRVEYIKRKSLALSKFDRVFLDLLYNIKTIKRLFVKKFGFCRLKKNKMLLEKESEHTYRYNSYQWLFTEGAVWLMFLIPLTYYGLRAIGTGEGISTIIVIVSVRALFSEFVGHFMNLMLNLSEMKADYEVLEEKLLKDDVERFGNRQVGEWDSVVFEEVRYANVRAKRKFESRIPYLRIRKGEKIAITGKSGAGKSTFLNLLTKTVDPDSGIILVDNVPYGELAESFFSTHFSYIPQDSELFDMSLKDNILLGKKVEDEAFFEVIAVCRLEELMHRVGDEQAFLGEKGIKVSAGERQRINIARGLVLSRDILILDEATANIDKKTAVGIMSDILKKYKDKTVIFISHDPEIQRLADRQVRFENGLARDSLPAAISPRVKT